MELKGRLKAIAGEVQTCDIVSDIGTDHAYIPIYLVGNRICRKAIATDVREGPIRIAQKNINEHRLENLIETRVGDGLIPIRPEEIDTVIIAGMGGLLIRDILEESMDKARKATRLILQPMNAIEVVREWLYKNGFQISSEILAGEGNKIYNIMSARWTGEPTEKDQVYYYIGEKLIERKDPLLEKYINRKIRQFDSIISGMELSEKRGHEASCYRYLRDSMKDILEKL